MEIDYVDIGQNQEITMITIAYREKIKSGRKSYLARIDIREDTGELDPRRSDGLKNPFKTWTFEKPIVDFKIKNGKFHILFEDELVIKFSVKIKIHMYYFNKFFLKFYQCLKKVKISIF